MDNLKKAKELEPELADKLEKALEEHDYDLVVILSEQLIIKIRERMGKPRKLTN